MQKAIPRIYLGLWPSPGKMLQGSHPTWLSDWRLMRNQIIHSYGCKTTRGFLCGNHYGRLLSGVFAYSILQFIAGKRMRGGWRILAYLPLILMAFVFPITIVGFYQQSNLWPRILTCVSPLVLGSLGSLQVSHSFVVRGKNEHEQTHT